MQNMVMPQVKVEPNLNFLVGLFLAEILRSRRTSIRRTAEIARRVVAKLAQIRSEADMLYILPEIERDFEEVVILKQALNFGNDSSNIEIYEAEIKEFAAKMFVADMAASARFLQDAAERGANIQKLCVKYPEFCRFLLSSSDKKELLQAFAFK